MSVLEKVGYCVKKTVKSVFLPVLVFMLLFAACSGGGSNNKNYEGKYLNEKVGYIQLNKDGTFLIDNGMKLSGKYSVSGEEIEFNVEKMYGEEVGNIVEGKIENDTITGPDSLKYKKEK